MPKPMMMTIEVEEVAFGKIFRTLDGMNGVVSIHLQGKGPRAKPNGSQAAPKHNGQTVWRLVMNALLASKGPLSRTELAQVIQAGGKAPTSLPDALLKMRKAKHIALHGKGQYKITAAGIKAATISDE